MQVARQGAWCGEAGGGELLNTHQRKAEIQQAKPQACQRPSM